MIYDSSVNEVAQNITNQITPPTPEPEAADLPAGAGGGTSASPPRGVTPDQLIAADPRLASAFRLLRAGYGAYNNAVNAFPALAQYSATHNPNMGVYAPDQYANPATAEYAKTLAQANPQFAPPSTSPFYAASSVLNTIPNAVGGLLNIPAQAAVRQLPQNIGPIPIQKPASVGAQFATSAAPYVAADVATGGALTPVYGAQAGLQAAQIVQQYQRGEIDQKTALEQLGMAVGPILAPIVLRNLAGAAKAGFGAVLPEQVAHADVTPLEEPGAGAPEPGNVGPEGAPSPVGDNLPAPPATPEEQVRQGAIGAATSFEQGRENVGMNSNAPLGRQAQAIENVTRAPEDVGAAARAFGASEQDATILQNALRQADFKTKTPDGLLNAGRVRQTLARLVSTAKGRFPGQTGALADIENQLGNYLYDQYTNAMPAIERADALIKRDMGPISNNLSHSVYEHPEEFNLQPDTVQAIQQAAAVGPKYALARGIDPTSAPPVKGNYLAQLYEGEDTSPLAAPVHVGRGETGAAESRIYPDRRVAIANGETLKDMSLPDLYAASIRRTNQTILDNFFRKTMLQNFGQTESAPGLVPVRNKVFTRPEEGTWYVPPAVKNMIDQKYASAGGVIRAGERAAGIGKTILVTPGDIGGVIGRLKNMTQRSPEIAIGMFRDLVGGVSPMDEAQASAVGLKGARGGSLAAESGLIPGKTLYSRITGYPWQALGKLAEWAHQGNIAIGKALGADFDPTTEAGYRNLTASAKDVNIVRMAAGGAQTESRNALERLTLLSQQTTRSLFNRVDQAATLLRPSASPYERFLAAKGIVSWAIASWGAASLVRMKFGDGKPAPFPISWDGHHFKYNSDWYMAKVGKYSIPTTADLALGNALIKSATILADAAANPSANAPSDVLGETVKPLGQFAVGRLSPLANLAPAISGIGYTPEGKFSTKMTAGQRIAAAVPQPIGLSKLLQNPSVLRDPTGLATEQLAGGFPPSPDAAFFAARDAMTKTGFPSYTKGPPSTETFNLSDQQKQQLSNFSGNTLSEMRANFESKYTDYYTTHDLNGRQLAQPISTTEAKRVASQAFSNYSTVKDVQSQMTKSEHQWAHDNPYDLVKAVEAGAIVPDAYEKTVVAWARAHPQPQ